MPGRNQDPVQDSCEACSCDMPADALENASPPWYVEILCMQGQEHAPPSRTKPIRTLISSWDVDCQGYAP
jgi:hypothetical protein